MKDINTKAIAIYTNCGEVKYCSGSLITTKGLKGSSIWNIWVSCLSQLILVLDSCFRTLVNFPLLPYVIELPSYWSFRITWSLQVKAYPKVVCPSLRRLLFIGLGIRLCLGLCFLLGLDLLLVLDRVASCYMLFRGGFSSVISLSESSLTWISQ